MKKFSHLTRTSLLLGFFFLLDKILAFVRSIIIARQFRLSPELDAFNVANNLPDLLFALISGGSLAFAFIPILSVTLALHGRRELWNLFSRIANLAFLVTAGLSVIVALLADKLVGWQLGVAPGFGPQPQQPQQPVHQEHDPDDGCPHQQPVTERQAVVMDPRAGINHRPPPTGNSNLFDDSPFPCSDDFA